MSLTITVPREYPYVAASLVSTVFLLLGQSMAVGRARKAAGIKYPQMYAEKAEADASRDANYFNCAQRAHQNTLESIPILYLTTVLTGLRYPVLAASACAFWVVGRISYTRGYLTGDPANRGNALYRFSALASVGLLAGSVYTTAQFVLESL
ncbi:hypothetical protein BD779DRAFT_1666708 [Infundibulicybe gibba]|nr:hypothetical protein BD779DRAFT_1666708 [Infundibulicybe gibba]